MINQGLSIVIPTFNEKHNIIGLISSIQKIFGYKTYEIIVIDDNSPDGTYNKIVKEFGNDKKVKTILRKNERGLGTAILRGIKSSSYPVIVGMDADFNHPPETITRLTEEIQSHDLVVASRFIKSGGMEEKKRYLPTLMFNLFLKHILRFPVSDNTSGFYAVWKNKLLKLPLDDIFRGYGEYHIRLMHYAQTNNFKITEVPVYYKKRKYGRSKSNLGKMFLGYLYCALKLRLGK